MPSPVTQEDGSIRVDPQEVGEEELIEAISELFRQSRAARRRGRDLNALTERIEDADLKSALQSPGGKVVFGDHLNRRLAQLVSDGFDRWVNEHFESTSDGYRIREGAEEAIRDLIQHVKEIKQELQNADF